jgi:hypothetical protein
LQCFEDVDFINALMFERDNPNYTLTLKRFEEDDIEYEDYPDIIMSDICQPPRYVRENHEDTAYLLTQETSELPNSSNYYYFNNNQ